LSTTSKRSRGETPYAVAQRRNVGVKESSASSAMSRSARTFDSPYAVTGLSADSSVPGASLAAP